MSTHPWFNLVLGGVDKPRIGIVGENLCTNPRFSENTTGWSVSGNAILTRSANVLSYGEYSGKLTYLSSTLAYAQYSKTYTSGSALGKKYAVAFRIWNDTIDNWNVRVEITTQHEVLAKYKIVTNLNKPIRVGFITEACGTADSTVTVKIYGSDEITPADKSIYFDDLYINEISEFEDILFPAPNESKLTFEKYVQGETELFDGKIQEFNKKWRPHWNAKYQAIEKNVEFYKNNVANASALFVMPHSDFLWGFFGIWKNDDELNYSFNRYFAHASEIDIKGTELLLEKIPREVEYIPLPVLIKISIESVPSGIGIYLNRSDYYGLYSGITAFERYFEEDETVRIIAPATYVSGGDTYEFVGWYDSVDVLIQESRDLLYTVPSGDYTLVATYSKVIVPGSETPGYGDNYGGGGGDGYGIVL